MKIKFVDIGLIIIFIMILIQVYLLMTPNYIQSILVMVFVPIYILIFAILWRSNNESSE